MTPPGGSAQDYTSDAYGDLAAPGGDQLRLRRAGPPGHPHHRLGSATSLPTSAPATPSPPTAPPATPTTPSGNRSPGQQSGGTAYATLTDQHGDVTGAFSPTATAQGLAASASYGPYGAKTTANYTGPSATRASTPTRRPAW